MKPIHFASIQGNVKAFKALTKLGSDPRSPTQNDVRTYERLPLLVMTTVLVFAVAQIGRQPIHYACGQGHVLLVTTLVEEYNVDPCSKDNVLRTYIICIIIK